MARDDHLKSPCGLQKRFGVTLIISDLVAIVLKNEKTTCTVLIMNRGEKSSNLRKKSRHNGTLTWGASQARRTQTLGNGSANNVSNNKDAIKAINTCDKKKTYGSSDRKVNVFVFAETQVHMGLFRLW